MEKRRWEVPEKGREKKEDQRERGRKKKMQVHEKAEKTQIIAFFQ